MKLNKTPLTIELYCTYPGQYSIDDYIKYNERNAFTEAPNESQFYRWLYFKRVKEFNTLQYNIQHSIYNERKYYLCTKKKSETATQTLPPVFTNSLEDAIFDECLLNEPTTCRIVLEAGKIHMVSSYNQISTYVTDIYLLNKHGERYLKANMESGKVKNPTDYWFEKINNSKFLPKD